MNRKDVEAIEQVLAERTVLGLPLEVGIGCSHDSSVDLHGLVSTHAPEAHLLENAEEVDLNVERGLAELIQKSVPPSDISKTPRRRPEAPVKLPFSCPNNSLSSSVSVKAPQLMLMKGCSRRRLRS